MPSLPSTANVAIIGSGPQAMTLAIQLLESNLDSKFGDSDRSRLHFWSKQTGKKMGAPSTPSRDAEVIVFDPSGEWMTQWRRNFRSISIPHLRSPIKFHPGPLHDALLAYAIEHGREDEIIDDGCFDDLKTALSGTKRKIGTSLGFNEAGRKFFSFPSRQLFEDFCFYLVEEYRLADILFPFMVSSIQVQDDGSSILVLKHLGQEKTLHCQHVVYAANIAAPVTPEFLSKELPERRCNDQVQVPLPYGFTWALCQHESLELLLNSAPSRSLRIGIVGVGMTAAHLAVKLATQSAQVREVVLLARRSVSVHHFDSSIIWSSRFQNVCRHDFLCRELEDRAEILRTSRHPGSVTTKMRQQLQNLENVGHVRIMEGAIVESFDYTETPSARARVQLHLSTGQDEVFDYVILATGFRYNVEEDPLLGPLVDQLKLPVVSGLPRVQHNLALAANCNVYVMGVYAALQTGPDALNLSGGVRSSRLIADSLQETLAPVDGDISKEMVEYCTGNPFSMLSDESCV